MADAGSNIADQLAKLASLRDSGALSQGEFELAKSRVLGPASGDLPTRDSAARPGPTVPGRASSTITGQGPQGWTCAHCHRFNENAKATCWNCGQTPTSRALGRSWGAYSDRPPFRRTPSGYVLRAVLLGGGITLLILGYITSQHVR